jgi:hypothetical protein
MKIYVSCVKDKGNFASGNVARTCTL